MTSEPHTQCVHHSILSIAIHPFDAVRTHTHTKKNIGTQIACPVVSFKNVCPSAFDGGNQGNLNCEPSNVALSDHTHTYFFSVKKAQMAIGAKVYKCESSMSDSLSLSLSLPPPLFGPCRIPAADRKGKRKMHKVK